MNTYSWVLVGALILMGVAPVHAAPSAEKSSRAAAGAKSGAPAKKKKAADGAKLGRARVGGVSVSGLTPHAARALLKQKLARKLDGRVVLTDGVKRVPVQRRQLGLSLDLEGMVAQAKAGDGPVPLRFKAEPSALKKALQRVAPRFTGKSSPARIVQSGGGVRIAPGAAARSLNVAASAESVAAQLEKNPAARTLRLVVAKKPSPLSADKLKGINARIGQFATRFNPGKEKRAGNMALAVKAIDGTLLSPGEVFSLNKTVGERSQKRGYRTAPVFENGKLVPGIGGGVSQVTGTLFNAALLAGLPIVEYRTHPKPISYLPVGRDATVAWNSFDMRFKNDTQAPVYISYKMSGSRLTATLYGARKPGQRVSVAVKSKKLGPHRIDAQLYRTIRRGGKVVKKEKVGESHYAWKPDKPQKGAGKKT